MDENPTGISDDLQLKHLTPLKSETSSVKKNQLFPTARNQTVAAIGCGFMKRSSSMPNILGDIKDNYFSKKSPPKHKLRKTLSASELMENLNLSSRYSQEESGLEGRNLQAVTTDCNFLTGESGA